MPDFEDRNDENLTPRLKKAYELLAEGKVREADMVLDENEIMADIERDAKILHALEEGHTIGSGVLLDNQDISWVLKDNGLLYIQGEGALLSEQMESEQYKDFDKPFMPWNHIGVEIKDVVIDGPIEVGDNAFIGSDSIESVVLQNGVTTIGNMSFWENDKLKEVSICDSVESIGDRAFEGTALENVKLPENTKSSENSFPESANITTNQDIGERKREEIKPKDEHDIDENSEEARNQRAKAQRTQGAMSLEVTDNEREHEDNFDHLYSKELVNSQEPGRANERREYLMPHKKDGKEYRGKIWEFRDRAQEQNEQERQRQRQRNQQRSNDRSR